MLGGIMNPCWLGIISNWAPSGTLQLVALLGRNSYLFRAFAGMVVNVKMEFEPLPQHDGMVPEENSGEIGLKCSSGNVEAGIGDVLEIGVAIGVGKSA